MTKRAILSVHDKTGLAEFGRDLIQLGWELIASGGTARHLRIDSVQALSIGEGEIGRLADGEMGAGLPERVVLQLMQTQALRYGENPHQAAALYAPTPDVGPLGGRLLQGKALSYNNLLDLDAAWRATEAFAEPAVVIVKHLSPCGIAVGETAAAAFLPALDSDRVSAFGGVIAVNRTVDSAFVGMLNAADLFVEAVIAPDFMAEAQTWFAAKKKNCRLVALAENHLRSFARVPNDQLSLAWRSILGGVIAQTRDLGDPTGNAWRVVSRRPPDKQEWAALRFAWVAVQQVKSNAIVLATERATVGIGGGLSSRVDAVKLAVLKAGAKAQGAVMASDAFFPFPDGLEAAAEAGVTAVIETGGSIRDDGVIAAADRLDLALVFTDTRHFRH